MMSDRPKVLLLVCITLNIASIRSADRAAKHFSPNFEAEYPHFTPFNNEEFVQMSSDLTVKDDFASEQPVLPEKVFAPKVHHKSHHHHDQPHHHHDSDTLQPFKVFVMDLYQNYRNQTIGSMLGVTPHQIEEVISENVMDEVAPDGPDDAVAPKKEKRRKNKVKRKNNANSITGGVDELKYNVGPGVNISMDSNKELVNVYLDEDCLKDVFTGRGRKNDLISKILPLFILPFLIQSAVVPFAVTTLKLLLVKSIVVGKIAIFLLIISALKSHARYSAGYESAAQYVVDPPSRRSEGIIGYRVEGRPTTWVN